MWQELQRTMKYSNVVQPDSPDRVRRFHATFYPRYGKKRIFYGKACDPELTWANEMRHGINTATESLLPKLVNPPLKTCFKQHLLDRSELLYDSRRNQPLGRTRDGTGMLPPHVNQMNFTFGIWSERGILCFLGRLIFFRKVSRNLYFIIV